MPLRPDSPPAQAGASGTVDVVGTQRPVPGAKDVLMRIRACGICGTDVSFLHAEYQERFARLIVTAFPSPTSSGHSSSP
jgi:D-arabinose 1-dehydrogenase-like Zn-dependent alcohol dehydrogenase